MTVQNVLTLLGETPTRIADAVSKAPPRQLHARLASGEWSANEVLAHMRACADVWGGCIERILAEDQPTMTMPSGSPAMSGPTSSRSLEPSVNLGGEGADVEGRTMNEPNRLTEEQVRAARCSFCGKSKSEVRKLVVAGARAPNTAICDECFVYVAEIMTGETPVVDV